MIIMLQTDFFSILVILTCRFEQRYTHSITIHDLRHSAVTHLLENGENILHVQKRLGHARLSTTMVYLHVADIEPVNWYDRRGRSFIRTGRIAGMS